MSRDKNMSSSFNPNPHFHAPACASINLPVESIELRIISPVESPKLQEFQLSKSMEAHTSSSSAALLHSVKKPLHKPWRKPVAPLPPNPTRVYKVRPVEFKDVVQKLTGAPEFQLSRLRTAAPAPLDLNSGNMQLQARLAAPAEVKAGRAAESNAVGFALSPSSNAWCSFLLLSPGGMSS
uniref:VQ domain-containing protein n=1 Tax=Kalanchoe fedtschenkoi TaxID=63787 RepID=A0A7N0TNM8_KALFE